MAGSTSRSGATDDDAAMMKKLVLSEEDPDDVVIEEEDAISEDSTRWMAITRVHMEKPYSQYWFYRNTRAAWDLTKEMKIRPLNDNLYTLKFSWLSIWEQVMEGPWTFRGNAVILPPHDGFLKPSPFALDTIEIFV